MINYDLLLLVIFGLAVLIFMLSSKKRTEIQKIAFPLLYFVIYRTKLGLNHMDIIAKKHPKLLDFIGYISIIVGFIGMAFIFFFLFKGAFDYFFFNAPSPVGLVLPGVETIPGLPKLSFWHWIIAIFVLATVHEFSHGVFARLNKIKVKSSGFALLGIILPIVPAAFVEPDEKAMAKAKRKSQLEVLSAGSFANFITALITFLIFSLLLGPFASSLVEDIGVKIVGLEENGPAALAGISQNESIVSINGIIIKNLDDFKLEIDKYAPYEKISIVTDANSYQVTLGKNPNNSEKSYLGVFLVPKEQIYNKDVESKYGSFFIKTIIWITILFSWLFIINLGVGMFNLLPLGILDGGKMFYLALLTITKNEKLTKSVWKYTNILLIILLLVLILPQIYKTLIMPLFSFIL